MRSTTKSQPISEEEEKPSYGVLIREMATEDRPRERLMRFGPHALSTPELLAIVLRTGHRQCSALHLADRILLKLQGLRGLAKSSVAEMAKIQGVGPVKAVQIAACVELGRRLASRGFDDRPIIAAPEDVADLVMPKLRDATKEQFIALLLDTKNRVLHEEAVSIGSLDSTIVHPREVFKSAVAHSAAGIVVVHNHPSGDPTPSQEDRALTARLVECGRLLGIDLVDHVIIGNDCWVSLKQFGWL